MNIIDYKAGTVDYVKSVFLRQSGRKSDDRKSVEATLTIVKFIVSGWGIEKAVHLSYIELPFSNLMQVVLILFVYLDRTQNKAQQTAKVHLTS